MARRAAGEDELSEDVPAQFKPPPEPSQLDYFLIANQISNYCDQVRSCVMYNNISIMLETVYRRLMLLSASDLCMVCVGRPGGVFASRCDMRK